MKLKIILALQENPPFKLERHRPNLLKTQETFHVSLLANLYLRSFPFVLLECYVKMFILMLFLVHLCQFSNCFTVFS